MYFQTANISDAKDCHSMSLRSASTEATTSPQEEVSAEILGAVHRLAGLACAQLHVFHRVFCEALHVQMGRKMQKGKVWQLPLVASISMQLGGLGTISGACDFESLVLEPQNRRGPVCRARHTFQDVSGRGTLGFWRCTVTRKLQMSFEPVRQICQ